MRYTSWRHLRVSSSLMETRVCLQKETYECLSCLMETRVCLHKETFGCLSCLMETNVGVSKLVQYVVSSRRICCAKVLFFFFLFFLNTYRIMGKQGHGGKWGQKPGTFLHRNYLFFRLTFMISSYYSVKHNVLKFHQMPGKTRC